MSGSVFSKTVSLFTIKTVRTVFPCAVRLTGLGISGTPISALMASCTKSILAIIHLWRTWKLWRGPSRRCASDSVRADKSTYQEKPMSEDNGYVNEWAPDPDGGMMHIYSDPRLDSE